MRNAPTRHAVQTEIEEAAYIIYNVTLELTKPVIFQTELFLINFLLTILISRQCKRVRIISSLPFIQYSRLNALLTAAEVDWGSFGDGPVCAGCQAVVPSMCS